VHLDSGRVNTAAATPAVGQRITVWSGNGLLEFLRALDGVDFRVGRGFVVGVAEALRGVRHPETGFCFSFPRGVTAGQLRDVARRFLERHSQLRHYTARSLVP